MALYSLAPVPKIAFLDNAGDVVPDGLLWTYESGTDTLTPTYTTPDGTAHTNPIVLDGSGRAPSEIYLPPGVTQKWVFEQPAPIVGMVQTHGAVIWTAPTVTGVPLSASNQDVPGVFGEDVTADDVVYLSDGSGSKTAGRWYKASTANDYSSIDPEVGFAVNDADAGDTGTVRMAGQLTVAGPLTPGALYYLATSPGTITATMPVTNTRFVGQAESLTSLIVSPNPPNVVLGGSDANVILGVQVFS